MWYFVEIFDDCFLNNTNIYTIEKLTIKNNPCFLVVISDDIFDKRSKEIIENNIDRYTNFTVFVLISKEKQKRYVSFIPRMGLDSIFNDFSSDDGFAIDTKNILNEFCKQIFKKDYDFIITTTPIKSFKEVSRMILKENFPQMLLNFVRASVLICAVEVSEKGNIVGQYMPSSTEIQDFLQKYKEQYKRDVEIDVNPKIFSDILSNEEFQKKIIKYLDFLRNDFLSLYTDKSGILHLVKIVTGNFTLEYIKMKEKMQYVLVTSNDNEFHINLINKNIELRDFKEYLTRQYQLKIKNNYIEKYPENFIEQIKKNIGFAYPRVITDAQFLMTKKQSIRTIEVEFDICKFVISHMPKNDTITCYN